MKNIVLILCFSSIILSSSFAKETNFVDMSEYETLFAEISDKRVGVSSEEIKKVKNPFIFKIVHKTEDGEIADIKVETIYNLYAILGDKVKINDSWYSINDQLGYYKLSKIKQNSVLLSSASETKELFIRKQNASNVKFSSK
ncbi:MAG TPA: hypothetical protein CFH79_04480 [Sulfurospirillum sp. UBA11407]|nr:MAG TPA: hypothetical protein CFH79_04480 [Sulfurospirillum sp. UBA11407]